MKITYGADPEFFVSEIKTGKIVPACGLFGGHKSEPVALTPDGGFLEDGVTIEFNVTPEESLSNLRNKLDTLYTAFQVKFPGYTIVPLKGHHHFGDRMLRQWPQAMTIGCATDFWCYGIRNTPQISKFRGNRFAGGHIHIGLEKLPEGWTEASLIPVLDVLLLVSSVYYSDAVRYPFYGHPGIFRYTPYGFEYRSMDNWWASPHNSIHMDGRYQSKVTGQLNHLDYYLREFWHAVYNDPKRVQTVFDNYWTNVFENYLTGKKALYSPHALAQISKYPAEFIKQL